MSKCCDTSFTSQRLQTTLLAPAKRKALAIPVTPSPRMYVCFPRAVEHALTMGHVCTESRRFLLQKTPIGHERGAMLDAHDSRAPDKDARKLSV
jgi:hypothetical protein